MATNPYDDQPIDRVGTVPYQSEDRNSSSASVPSAKKGKRDSSAAVSAALQFSRESAQRSFDAADEAVSRSANKMDDRPKYSEVPSYRRGGRVRRGGIARLHKGERRLSRGGGR